jgi:drug/metabolite transporter (DMT)-like permease
LGVFSGAAASLEFQIGQLWLVLGAVLYGLHILLLGKYGHGRNAYRFAMVQISAVAVICWGFAIGDGIQWPPSDDVWVAIIFTAVLSTAAAFWIQTWAQTLMDASRAALIMTSEVAFTAIIAIAAGQEPLTVAVTVGGALMLAAMLIVEWPSKKILTLREPESNSSSET